MDYRIFHGYKIYENGEFTSKDSDELRIPHKHQRGYLWASFTINGVKKKLLIHRVVAMAFIENPYNKPQVNHIDGDKTNNHVSNLEWCTNYENRQHAVNHNLHAKGEQLAKKLSIEKVKRIREEYIPYSTDNNQYTIAKKYGISQRQVMKIVNGLDWKL